MASIEHQQRVIGGWLNGQIVANLFRVWALDNPLTIEARYGPELDSLLHEHCESINYQLIEDAVAHDA
ncbi:MAG: hypothetical protein WBY53_00050, partial [Acidobacteriaceae bacterium]